MDLSRLRRSGSRRQGRSDRSWGGGLDRQVDLSVKWICRGSGEMDLGVKLDLIAAGAGKAVAGFLENLTNLIKISV